MAKEIQTNGMPIFMGRAPGLNAYDQIPNLSWLPKIANKLAAYTVLASESGMIFSNVGATTLVVYTLPAIGDGPWVYFFVAGEDFAIRIDAETVGTMRTFNDVAANSLAFSTSSEIVGGGVMCFSDGTSLWALIMGAGGHRQTSTVAT